MKWKGIIITLIVIIAIAGISWWSLKPQPIGVDLAIIKRGTLIETVDDEGVVKIKDTYQISTPIGGDILRIPYRVGDFVEQGKIIASITPQKSSFLDERTLLEAQAGVKTSEAALVAARTNIKAAQSELDFLQNELDRTNKLFERGLVTKQAAEQIKLEYDRAKTNLSNAESNLELRQRQLEQAQARLFNPNGSDYNMTKYSIKAPVSGQILEIANESSRSLPAGAHLLTIGNPRNLEVVVEILSTDAIRIEKGANATITGWGKDEILHARVINIEPIGFTKISALGIEEQRVNIHLEILSDAKIWSGLGHLYRVFVSIEVQKAQDVLLIPTAALFRSDNEWSVFIIESDNAKIQQVKLGIQNANFAAVLNGINENDRVILHPNDKIVDGGLIAERVEE